MDRPRRTTPLRPARTHGARLVTLPDPSFWARVDARGPCWIWTGAGQTGGYGIVRREGRRIRVHRYAWELLVGPIPAGLVIDHLCRVKLCVNPDHLEPVTQQTNMHRAMVPSLIAHRKGQCTKGHPLNVPDNYVRPDGYISCRTCRREYHRAYYHRARKAAA